MSPHARDPKIQVGAAASLGKLVAQGVIEHDDALEAVFRVADANAPAGHDRSGMRARLSWQIMDTAEGWRRARRWAEMDIRKGIRPMLVPGVVASEIVREAHRINEAKGEPLIRREVREIVAEEMQSALRAMRFQRRSRRVG